VNDAQDRSLEAEARALLLPARTPEAAPAAVKARALRRLELALPIAAGVAAPVAASWLSRALATRVPAWSLLLSFAAGGAIAVVATRRAPDPPRNAGIEIAPPAMSAATAVPSAAAASSEIPPATAIVPTASATPSARPPAPSAKARASSDGSLEAERAVLDVARTALGRADGANALHATEEHARRFPRGSLAEEREAMSIQALRLLHRDDEAEARLGRFRARFPTSLIRPALEATDGGAP
jgi:hypothetical protein